MIALANAQHGANWNLKIFSLSIKFGACIKKKFIISSALGKVWVQVCKMRGHGSQLIVHIDLEKKILVLIVIACRCQ